MRPDRAWTKAIRWLAHTNPGPTQTPYLPGRDRADPSPPLDIPHHGPGQAIVAPRRRAVRTDRRRW
ncbi:MAG: hypothetical protein AAFV53_19995 [Myxococcota bacterium]